MRLARWRTAGLGMTLGAVLFGGIGMHRWGLDHVSRYTGDTARTADCVSCHVSAKGGTLLDRVLKPRYRTPLDIAVSPDGRSLYVTAQDAGALLVIDAAARRLERAIPVGLRPHSVVLSADGAVAYVSDSDADAVVVVDLLKRAVAATLPAGFGPAGVALSPDGQTLFVANALGDDISVVDVARAAERARLAAGRSPYGAAASPDGSHVLVTNRLAAVARPTDPPTSEVTVVEARTGRIVARQMLRNAHLLEGAAFVPPGDLALVAMVRPKNLVPALQVERGWMMTNGIAVIDLERRRTAQLPLDDEDAFFADPSDVAVTPDGRLAFVSHGGVDAVSVVDVAQLRGLLDETPDAGLEALANRLAASRRYVTKRIATGPNPRGLAASPDGRFVYVAERLGDTVGVIDVLRLERVAGIDLGGPRHVTLVRRGERVFNSARATLQRQFSCRSCHPENHADGLQYDFEPDGLGRNIVDNRTLLGLRGTGPFKWSGRNTSLYMQCGIRFARFLTRSQPFPDDDLNALVAFLSSLEPPRNRYRPSGGAGTEGQKRGREIFERAVTRDGKPIAENNRCLTCHPGPLYSDRIKHDVASASQGDSEAAFDTPQLANLTMSPPYLHDGKARTLEEIWTLYSPEDTHGVTNDLGKQGLNDLIEYLKA
ncbi:MAG: beta-propeller fold lactonase family protein, partial [Acidobacteriota bacterium]